MLDNLILETEEKFKKAILTLKNEFSKITVDKASLSVIENINVIYYGERYSLSQLAVVLRESSNIIIIKPFDKKNITIICKEVVNLNLDLNPFVANDEIKVVFPKMTVERREFFVKKIKLLSENIKISVRNVRRQANGKIKTALKENIISRDNERFLLGEIDSLMNRYVDLIDSLILKKETDLLKI